MTQEPIHGVITSGPQKPHSRGFGFFLADDGNTYYITPRCCRICGVTKDRVGEAWTAVRYRQGDKGTAIDMLVPYIGDVELDELDEFMLTTISELSSRVAGLQAELDQMRGGRGR